MATVLLTGMNGTVAPVLAAALDARGFNPVAWDREAVSPDHPDAVARFITDVEPVALVHCAMGSPLWAAHMAQQCATHDIRFLHTGSVSVFGAHQRGPFTLDSVPEPDDDYGRYKLECEQHVLAANAEARVVRLGWQIALRSGGNQMADYFTRLQAEKGEVAASTEWFPACSFLDDTARVLAEMTTGDLAPAAGVYMLDSNPGWSLFDIAGALNAAMSAQWQVRATDDRNVDHRMDDPRIPVPTLADRLGLAERLGIADSSQTEPGTPTTSFREMP